MFDTRSLSISPEASAWLDALRVFLLGQVVLGHLAAIALPDIPDLGGGHSVFGAAVLAYRLTTRFGLQSAYLFVLLSGYLVGGPLFAKMLDGERIDFGDFVRRRLTRILPALWIALCVSACFDISGAFGLGATGIYSSQRAYDFVMTMTVANFVGNLLCLEPTFVTMFGSNGPLWTLGYIVQFYVVGFALFRLIARWTRWRLIGVGGGLIVALAFRPEWVALFGVWCLGAFSRNFSVGERLLRPSGLIAGGLLFIAANRAPGLASIFICGLAGVFVLSWARTTGARLVEPLRRVLAWVASVSYEAYAVHYPAAFFLYAVFLRERAQNVGVFAIFLLASLLTVAGLSVAVHRAAQLAYVRCAAATRR